jgi:hypothetical protein
MFQQWLQLTMLAQVVAVLLTGPVLAAVDCQRCCQLRSQATVEGASHDGCPLCHVSEAAGNVGEVGSPRRGPCQDCPRCQSSKPAPGVVGPAIVAFAIDWQLLPLDVPAQACRVALWSTQLSETDTWISPGPPPRVLFCSWLI